MAQIGGKVIEKLKEFELQTLNYLGRACKSQTTDKSPTDEKNYILN